MQYLLSEEEYLNLATDDMGTKTVPVSEWIALTQIAKSYRELKLEAEGWKALLESSEGYAVGFGDGKQRGENNLRADAELGALVRKLPNEWSLTFYDLSEGPSWMVEDREGVSVGAASAPEEALKAALEEKSHET